MVVSRDDDGFGVFAGFVGVYGTFLGLGGIDATVVVVVVVVAATTGGGWRG